VVVGAKVEDRLRIRRGLKAVVSAGMMRANTRAGKVPPCLMLQGLGSACRLLWAAFSVPGFTAWYLELQLRTRLPDAQ
jgi:hypothetical protein